MEKYIVIAIILVGLGSFQFIKAQKAATITKVDDKAQITQEVVVTVDVKELDIEIIGLQTQKSGLESQIVNLQTRISELNTAISTKEKVRADIVTKYPELEPK